jgi:hypothetical protein
MVRQYGLGYVFVDQSASLLSKVAFANSYATIALSQKLRSDVHEMASAMNLTDEQKEALNTLPVGSAVIRLADEHPEPFLVKVPLCAVREGSVLDKAVKERMARYHRDSSTERAAQSFQKVVPRIPPPDKDSKTTESINENKDTHPPSPNESKDKASDPKPKPPYRNLSREEIRFLSDVAGRPLSTTVSRYQRLNLSRRRGNAVRQHLVSAGIIEAVAIATRCGQVVLYQLTDPGRAMCSSLGIEAGPRPRESLEHSFWVNRASKHFERKGYEVKCEHPVKGNGAIDILAQKPGEKIAIEVETGKSDIRQNLNKIRGAGFDRIVLLATSPAATEACHKAANSTGEGRSPAVEMITWVDIS